jgi:hypothetical protein
MGVLTSMNSVDLDGVLGQADPAAEVDVLYPEADHLYPL